MESGFSARKGMVCGAENNLFIGEKVHFAPRKSVLCAEAGCASPVASGSSIGRRLR